MQVTAATAQSAEPVPEMVGQWNHSDILYVKVQGRVAHRQVLVVM